jgi:hypothetical protein
VKTFGSNLEVKINISRGQDAVEKVTAANQIAESFSSKMSNHMKLMDHLNLRLLELGDESPQAWGIQGVTNEGHSGVGNQAWKFGATGAVGGR